MNFTKYLRIISAPAGILFLLFFALLITSCNDQNVIVNPVVSNNLVIVTDNDEGGYLMVKILGKVRSSFPDIHITYLQTKQFNVAEGAYLLYTALNSFPQGTVIAGIVEPGAGGKRLVFSSDGKKVFAPDNTLATWCLVENPGIDCYYVENPDVLGGNKPEDLAFEDFYADAICSLLGGKQLKSFGSLCSNPAKFDARESYKEGDYIYGQVLFTDNFGNCITNIPKTITAGLELGANLELTAGGATIPIKYGQTYSSVAEGENVCFLNSSNFLELAVNYGNFSTKYSLNAGASVKLVKK
jgi:S-adenosylmethionine hydrolase